MPLFDFFNSWAYDPPNGKEIPKSLGSAAVVPYYIYSYIYT